MHRPTELMNKQSSEMKSAKTSWAKTFFNQCQRLALSWKTPCWRKQWGARCMHDETYTNSVWTKGWCSRAWQPFPMYNHIKVEALDTPAIPERKRVTSVENKFYRVLIPPSLHHALKSNNANTIQVQFWSFWTKYIQNQPTKKMEPLLVHVSTWRVDGTILKR